MIDNKGFTLIEVLVSLVIIAIVSIFITNYIGSTLSASKSDAYSIMKDGIISSSYDYLRECSNKIMECNLVWNDDKTTFYAEDLKSKGYFKNLNSPIDDKYLGNCLQINAVRDNGSFDVNLIDNCY